MQRRADNDFVLFPSHGESPQLQQLESPSAAPKLNAQTLFAFGVSIKFYLNRQFRNHLISFEKIFRFLTLTFKFRPMPFQVHSRTLKAEELATLQARVSRRTHGKSLLPTSSSSRSSKCKKDVFLGTTLRIDNSTSANQTSPATHSGPRNSRKARNLEDRARSTRATPHGQKRSSTTPSPPKSPSSTHRSRPRRTLTNLTRGI